ncbi:acyl carrier protein [Streptomyces sp. NPDC050428]|uniref:acyl carrier protein n=1 Tax=Streptomyces sp. NPDC050428 TaxID=3155757 RepID=UPI003419D7E0
MTTSPAVPTDADILGTLREALAELLEPADLAQVDLDSIGPTTPLLSLPLDSITLVAAMTRVENEFKVFIPEQKAFGFQQVGDIADFVRERVQAKAARAAK